MSSCRLYCCYPRDLTLRKIELQRALYREFRNKSPLGRLGSDVCLYATKNGSEALPSIAAGGLPGYSGWYRPHSPLLYWYRTVHFGPRPFAHTSDSSVVTPYSIPTSRNGKMQYLWKSEMRHPRSSIRHQLDASTLTTPWTTVLLCPLMECQGDKNATCLKPIHSSMRGLMVLLS